VALAAVPKTSVVGDFSKMLELQEVAPNFLKPLCNPSPIIPFLLSSLGKGIPAGTLSYLVKGLFFPQFSSSIEVLTAI
jgi:hypothetical protein